MVITHRMELPRARELMSSYNVHQRPSGLHGLNLQRKIAAEPARESPAQMPSPDQPQGRLHICSACGLGFPSSIERANHVRQGKCPASLSTGATGEESDD
jgi:hypothetical protein